MIQAVQRSRAPLGRSPFVLLALVALPALAGCVPGTGEPPPWPAGMRRGLDYAGWTAGGYGTGESREALDELARTGAGEVAIVVTFYLSDRNDSTVEEMAERTPTAESIRAATSWAREAGLRVTLKLHVDVLGGAYRGMIDPDDPMRWFDTFGELALRWAEVAAVEGFDELWIATEMESMTPYIDRWASLIEAVREVFDGPVGYAASWSDIRREPTIALGRLVDHIGVDAYFPVADWPNPTVTDMVVGWQPWLLELEELERATGRPVLITELGCASRLDGPISPWDYLSTAPVDHEVHARYYEASLRALATTEVGGVFFWAWGVRAPEAGDGSHTPRRKPAVEVLRRFWGGQ